MGLRDLFRKDAGAALDKAEELLERGAAVRALDAARRHIQDKDARHRERAQDLVARARRELVRSSLEKADASEAAGDPADAADWVRAALQHVSDDDRRGELEARQAELERRAEMARREPSWEDSVRRDRDEPAAETDPADGGEDDAADELDDDPGTDPGLAARLVETAPPAAEDPVEAEIRYDLLVDTLVEEAAVRYADRDATFRTAYLAINDGEPGAARDLLDGLVAAAPDDPVLRLERGRCRLMLGDAAAARDDLEVAWEALGDAHLDRAGSLRLPTLWAEASMEADDPEAVLERLADLARPQQGDGDLTGVYGQALVADGRLEEGRRFLARAVEAFPKRQDLPLALAQVLSALGERQLAIDLLERAVAPSCAGGSCSKPPLHLPSLRTLAALHLGMRHAPAADVGGEPVAAEGDDTYQPTGRNLDRVEDLMRWIAGAQGGRLSGVDHLLAARYHDLVGDEERAEEARRRAAVAGTEEAVAAAGPGPLATGKAAL